MSQLSTDALIVMRQALANFIENGSESVSVVFFKGDPPTSISSPTSELNQLIKIHLPKPSIKQIGVNFIEFYEPAEELVLLGGVATWAQLRNAANNNVMTLIVGEDILMSSDELVQGGVLRLPSFKIFI